MKMDFLDPANAEGMLEKTDAAIALDFLLAIKNSIRNYAFAVTETASPEVRDTLYRQLEQALDLHEEASELMMNKGWLYPYDVGKQVELDLKSAAMALDIAEMTLFPVDTDRQGMMATPDQ
ncbi:spore coat protein [Bacillus sp. PK3_68]|uniref:spore coat protein n=1 Tax=Bacillus sp. PK3_68 TaxID=2027408 RepID=UPI000E760029|nr:spore coat protein [Bacillus sp. PK3_68]RJS59042.1 spore coat protein [Bacillus sp. PK3_68]